MIYFILATWLAIAGNIGSYYQSIQKMAKEQTQAAMQLQQTYYFIRLAIYEAFPIVLMVMGFMHLSDKQPISYFSVALILVGWLFGAFAIRKVTKAIQANYIVSPESVVFLTSFKVIAVLLLMMFPATSLILMLS